MLRRLAHGSVLLLLLMPSLASALGLGSIEARSGLNEPLDARIPLTATSEELESLRVGLAPADAYQRANLDRPFFLASLAFEVVTQGSGAPYVKVSTQTGIREPFVSFLVEVRWAGGRMLREYTLLLDPPVVTPRDQSPAPVRSADAPAAQTPARQPAAVAETTPSRGTGTVPRQQTAGAREYGPVQRNDTAWDIALGTRADGDISVHQQMMALVRANPDAFRDGNVNNMRAGAILRLPERSDVLSMSAAEARREFARQLDVWNNRRTGSEPAPVVAAAPAAAEPEGRLQVVGASERSGDDATAAMDAEGLEQDSATVQRLRQELTLSREAEAEMRAANEELRQMADEMRQRLNALERAINLPADIAIPSGDAVATTPGVDAFDPGDFALAPEDPVTMPGELELPADTRSLDAELAARAAGPLDDPAMDQPAGEISAVADGPTAASPEVTVAGPEDTATPVPPQSLAPWEDPRLQMLGGGVMLALLLLLLLIMRRRRQASDEDDMSDIVVAEPFQANDGNARQAAAAGFTAGQDADDDPLEQADAFISGGHYEQAADAVATALATDPDNKDLRLKLLEIHSLNEDRGAFEAEAQGLYALVDGDDDPVWQRASRLGRGIAPENPLFTSDEGETESALMETMDMDVSDEASADAATRVEAARTTPASFDSGRDISMPAAGAEDDLSDLDFALGETSDFDKPKPADSNPESAVADGRSADDGLDGADDQSMDFELDQLSRALENSDPAQSTPATAKPTAEEEDFSLDFLAADSSPVSAPSGDAVPDAPRQDSSETVDEFSFDDMNLDTPAADTSVEPSGQDTPRQAGKPVADQDAGDHIGFDLDSLADNHQQSAPSGLTGDADQAQADADDSFELDFEESAKPSLSKSDEAISAAFSVPDSEEDAEDDALFETGDENATKLDLARAYLDMGDAEGARGLLEEVLEEGTEEQVEEARSLLDTAD